MIVMGVDQSYTSTGIVVLNNNVIIYASIYKTTNKDDMYVRASNIAKKVRAVAKKFNPEIISIEGLAFGSRGNVTRDLAGLQFVVMTQLQTRARFNCVVTSPTALKKFATGSGKASKEDMVESLPPKVQVYFRDDIGAKKTRGLYDLTDAYFLAKFPNKDKPEELQ